MGYQCSVIKVTDGDSVKIQCPQLNTTNISPILSTRLINIDAPELSQLPWGRQAREQLSVLLSDQPITVYFKGRDIYHRYLVQFESHHIDINLAMVKRGYARVYKLYHPPVQYSNAMQVAKRNKLGIWLESGLHQDPQRWRRLSH
ncbi:MAG: thermonuclease family protein [Ostreibacterium sp.]